MSIFDISAVTSSTLSTPILNSINNGAAATTWVAFDPIARSRYREGDPVFNSHHAPESHRSIFMCDGEMFIGPHLLALSLSLLLFWTCDGEAFLP
ncbi:hypothetical protein BDW62DRAFT_176784 [Aspergillus aurantiobrunneus]